MPALLPVRRRTSFAVLAAALAVSAAGLVSVQPAVAAAPGCSFSQLDVVAHQDDDLLFQSPDLIDTINDPGSCVTTAYVTAGDDGKGTAYWQGRESGMKAAYAQMAGVTNSWRNGSTELAGRTVATSTLIARPSVQLVFLRLPDGGYPSTKSTGVPYLEMGYTQSVTAIDGSASWSREGLVDGLLELMTDLGADTVHTQDYTRPYRNEDHYDHTATALLTEAASDRYTAAHTLVAYEDYESQARPANVTGAALSAKIAAFDAYTPYDPQICRPVSACPTSIETAWLQRQVILATKTYAGPAPTPTPTPTPTETPTPTPTETSTPAPTQTAAPTPTQPADPTPTQQPTTPPVVVAPPTTAPAPALPAEQGRPKVSLKDATLTSAQFRSKGASATVTGLTPGKRYQLSYLAGDSGAVLGGPVTASRTGSITGTWKPSTKAAPALAAPGTFSLRVVGVQTTLSTGARFTVKDASSVSWRSAHRSGKKVTLSVSVHRQTATKDGAFKGVRVAFQKRVGSTWRTVATDGTSSRGVATRTVKAGTAKWRAVVTATATVWGDASRVIRR